MTSMNFIGLDIHKKPSDWAWSRRGRKGTRLGDHICAAEGAAVTARDRQWCS